MILKLTNLGNHARLYGVQTPPGWWRQQFRDAVEVMDQDGDWEQMLQERRDGIDQLMHDLREHGIDWFQLGADGSS